MTSPSQFLDRLRLRHLRLIEMIDRHSSLRVIAEHLNVSQPALSQMVKDLEHAFDADLVTRSARGVSLTAAGQLALQRARSGLASIDHLARELQTDETPVLRIGTNPALLIHTFPGALRRLHAAHPRMRFHIRAGMESTMMQALTDGILDCYIGVVDWNRVQSRLSARLDHRPLDRSPLSLACRPGHPLAGRRDLKGGELLQYPWALPRVGSNNRVKVETAFRQLGFTPPAPMIELEGDPNAFLEIASTVDVIVCVPWLSLAPHLHAGAVCALTPVDFELEPVSVEFVTLVQDADTATITALRAAVTETMRARQP